MNSDITEVIADSMKYYNLSEAYFEGDPSILRMYEDKDRTILLATIPLKLAAHCTFEVFYDQGELISSGSHHYGYVENLNLQEVKE